MGRIRKVLTLFLLSFALSTPLYANMPVIDISAITQGISQFLTTVEQYTRQIQQWKVEYDKMVKAAKAIATGDFSQIMNGISSFATQIAGWDSTNKYADAFLNNLSNTAKLTDTIKNMSENLGNSLGSTWEWVTSLEDPTNLMEGFDFAGEFFGDINSSVGRTAGVLASYTARISDLGARVSAMDTQLKNGALSMSDEKQASLGIDDESIEKLRELVAEKEEAEATAYQNLLQASEDSSDSNDNIIFQYQIAYDQAVKETDEARAELQKRLDLKDSILNAYDNAKDQINQRLDEMQTDIVNTAASGEKTSIPNEYNETHSFGGFGD